MINLSILLSAIALVESGNDDNAIGRHGERSRYQITRTVWKQHCSWSFGTATLSPKMARSVALDHLRWLIKNGVSEYPWDMAYAWNAGRTRYVNLRNNPKSTVSKASSRYAFRVESVYNDLLTKSKRGSKPSNRP